MTKIKAPFFVVPFLVIILGLLLSACASYTLGSGRTPSYYKAHPNEVASVARMCQRLSGNILDNNDCHALLIYEYQDCIKNGTETGSCHDPDYLWNRALRS